MIFYFQGIAAAHNCTEENNSNGCGDNCSFIRVPGATTFCELQEETITTITIIKILKCIPGRHQTNLGIYLFTKII
jgi:hypothetical protein